MGSKKHKKDSKKKKHRSRSRSPIEGEERERKRHRKHKDRKKERSPDVEEVPVDSHLISHRERSDSEEEREALRLREYEHEYERERERERDRERRPQRERDDEPPYSKERSRSGSREAAAVGAGAGAGGGAQESLSIAETNRLRAQLGLKPLQVTETPASDGDDGKIKDDLGEFYHRPAANLAEQRKSEKIREKLEERKERRKLEQKLQTTLLAEESGDEDAAAWVKKSRELDRQKQEAAKRAALLDELDAEFGVGALVAEEEQQQRQAAYTADQLRGLRVAHHLDALGEERETILTLADKDVLADDDEDVLVNVNIVDDEKYKKNLVERKKALAGYKAYDDEAELEAAALGMRPVLAKYDDEIDKKRADKERGFTIGDDTAQHMASVREMMRRERLQGGVNKRLESLAMPAPRLATEYLDETEFKFKKPKRKGKIRKKAKEEPIDVEDYEQGGAPLLTDDTEVKPELLPALAVDEDEVEPDGELQTALARARRLRQPHTNAAIPKVEEILERVKDEQADDMESEEAGSSGMVLDATAEFCRTLGDIPTYGLAGNRDSNVELMDFDRDEVENDIEPDSSASGAWSRVDVGNEKPPDITAGNVVGLEAEPALGAGVAGALRLALSKGYLERAPRPPPRASNSHLLAARHYSIEDKTYGEDDKYGRRERGHHGHGPLTEFREKAGFRPNIKLEYADDEGRPLCPKEAFRYLSHKFHGKGPGKNKQEKRIKKAIQEGLMKKMSSTDTPLGTLQMLQEKQRETHSPYIVLSGSKRDTTH